MKIIAKNEIKHLTPSEISIKIIEVQKYLFELRIKCATKQSIKTHLFKKYKWILAQLLTREHQLKNSNENYET